MFMEFIYSSRHFQCLALVLSYINQEVGTYILTLVGVLI